MSDPLVHTTAAPEASLAQLVDVVEPPDVPWLPQTVGWEVVGVLLAVLALYLAWRAVRLYLRNRYRRDALAELDRLEAQWAAAPDAGGPVLAALAALVKRCALSAWPRAQVASLGAARWADFVVAHAGHAGHGARALAPLLREVQYHDVQALGRIPPQEGRALLEAAREWIKGHVSA